MRYPNDWHIGEWTFYQVTEHGFTGKGPLYGYEHDGATRVRLDQPKLGELYNSLEHAMAAAIAEKYTGPRGAGGSGVGTAADWFMRMIGADRKHDELTDAEAQDALRLAIADAAAESMGRDVPPPDTIKARWMRKHLEELGLALVRWRS